MKTRSVVAHNLETNKPGTIVRVKVIHSMGGLNYFDYKTYPKGYYFIVQPIEIHDGFERQTMGSGIKVFIEDAARMSKPKMTKMATTIDQHPKYQEVLTTVLLDHGLTLGDTIQSNTNPSTLEKQNAS